MGYQAKAQERVPASATQVALTDISFTLLIIYCSGPETILTCTSYLPQGPVRCELGYKGTDFKRFYQTIRRLFGKKVNIRNKLEINVRSYTPNSRYFHYFQHQNDCFFRIVYSWPTRSVQLHHSPGLHQPPHHTNDGGH